MEDDDDYYLITQKEFLKMKSICHLASHN